MDNTGDSIGVNSTEDVCLFRRVKAVGIAVGGATMFGYIKTSHLLELGDAEHVEEPENRGRHQCFLSKIGLQLITAGCGGKYYVWCGCTFPV
jgi:hypothetical protein